MDSDLHRRELFRKSILGLAGGAVLGSDLVDSVADAATKQDAAIGSEPAVQDFDFAQKSILAPDRVVRSACQFCNSLCGLDVQLRAGQVIGVTGVQEDPVQQGGICVKASMMPELLYNEHRLRTPMKRTSGEKGDRDSKFQPISWQQALSEIAGRMLRLRDQGDAKSIVSRTSGRLQRGVGPLIARLFAMLGSPNNTDVGPVCNDAGGNALATTFGLGNFTNGYGVDPATGKQDLGSAKCLLMLGTNQAETHPVTFAHLLRERQQTGAKLIVVDPRSTPTSAFADHHLRIRPHTDLALILGMIGHVIDAKLFDQVVVNQWTVGFDRLVNHIQSRGYSPEWASQYCDLPADKIRDIASLYARSKPAAIFCNAGISHQLNAFDTYRAIAMLAAITGNVGVPGGGCNFMHNTWPGGLNLPALKVDVPEIQAPALPVGPDSLAESILNGRPYSMRMLVAMGNPLMSSANTAKVQRAFKQLEYFVYTGLFMEESAWYADIILPVCSGLEFDGVYMRRDDRAIRWQSAAAPRVGESRPDWEIWIQLAHEIAKQDRSRPAEDWQTSFPLDWLKFDNLWDEFTRHTPDMAGMTSARLRRRDEPLNWPCPSPEHPGVKTLYLEDPTWEQAADSLGHPGKRFLTPSGKIELVTDQLQQQLSRVGLRALPEYYSHPETSGVQPRLIHQEKWVANPIHPQALTQPVQIVADAPRSESLREYPLVGTIGRPSVVHFAGVTQWTFRGKQLNGVRLIQIHPEIARQVGVESGDSIVVQSPRGEVAGIADVTEGVRPDTVFIPNTFGPAQAVGDAFGVPRYQSANQLTSDQHYDPLSGQQAYKCFACRVRKV